MQAMFRSISTSRHIRWLVVLAILTLGFYWKVTFTRQFSLLLEWESANQAYAWYNFAAQSIKQATLPVWDRYTFSGHTFIGEMQAGLFYPLRLLADLAPLDREGLFSERIYNYLYVLSHFLAAVFMYSLAISLDIETAGAVVAAVTFGFGGFVGRVVWPNILDASIWLPLIVLFLIRAVKAEDWGRRAALSALVGLTLGLTVIAGSLHVAIIDGLVLTTLLLYFGYQSQAVQFDVSALKKTGAVLLVSGIVAAGFSAIQLLPSIEYGFHSVRWIDSGPPIGALEKIPYFRLSETFRQIPRSFFSFLFGAGFIGDAEVSPYIGVLPFILAVLGAWRRSDRSIAKYLIALAIGSYLYALGSFSLLHGLLYLLPGLDKAREAGRFIYLTHFALSLLAGLGVQVILSDAIRDRQAVSKMSRAVNWICIVTVIALGIPVLYGAPAVNDWHFFSAILLIATAVCIARASSTQRISLFTFLFLIVFDLYAFNWTILNRGLEQRENHDYLAQLRDTRPIADFLRSKNSIFRVKVDAVAAPNMGDLWGIETVGGNAASMLKSYFLLSQSHRQDVLLNVRYLISQTDHPNETPVFTSGNWKVYEQADYLPRAWVVYRTISGESEAQVQEVLNSPGFDPKTTALLDGTTLRFDVTPERPATVNVKQHSLNSIELVVESEAPGLLVLSEINYPGWRATVNGSSTPILSVDGALRGVAVPLGHSEIAMDYLPSSLVIGSVTTFITVVLVGVLVFYVRRQTRERLGSSLESEVFP